jgi:hypothetical protein
MIEIPLTQGQVALIDDEDYDLVSQYKWYAHKECYTWYACTNIPGRKGKENCALKMHRLIMDVEAGQLVDHINRNGLDNRRKNLRPATYLQSVMNRGTYRGTSVYKGVSWSKYHQKWRAYIVVNKKQKFLGSFKDEVSAAKAYDEAAIKYFGDFAYLNWES